MILSPIYTSSSALFALTLLLLSAPVSSAHAQAGQETPPAEEESKNHVVAGFGLEMAYPFGGGSGDLLDIGSGANVNVGYDVILGSFRVLAGVIGSYLYFPTNIGGVHEEDVDLKRLQASIAGGYTIPFADDHAIIFDLFVHLGAGFLTASSVDEGGQSDTGFAFDIGLTIDYKAIPGLRIGVNGGYGQVLATYRDADSVKWGSTELHFALDF